MKANVPFTGDRLLENGFETAIELLKEMNADGRRKLPDDPPLTFIPKKLRPLIEQDGNVSRRAWEYALLTVIRDEVRAGNIYLQQSQRFGRFDDFFMSHGEWEKQRESFFHQAGLPEKAEDVSAYLTQRLDAAYNQFLARLPSNSYAQVTEEGWQLSTDSTQKMGAAEKERLAALDSWPV